MLGTARHHFPWSSPFSLRYRTHSDAYHREPVPTRGRTWPPSLPTHELSASDASDELVEGRVRHLIGVHLRRALHHVRQGSEHGRIGAAVIGVRVLFVGPQTDVYHFRSAWDDER